MLILIFLHLEEVKNKDSTTAIKKEIMPGIIILLIRERY